MVAKKDKMFQLLAHAPYAIAPAEDRFAHRDA